MNQITPEELESYINLASHLFKEFGGWTLLILFVLYVIFFPSQAEKLSSTVFKYLRLVWGGAEKKYITHDIQGRVNNYVNGYLKKQIKDFEPIKIKLKWVDENTDIDSFIKEKKLLVRMRMSNNQNKNFVHASVVFIAQNVLRKAKRYVSKKQRESIDLFVSKKLFEEEKEEVMTQFIDDYLINGIEDEKVGDFFEKYDFIDSSGLFFPIFVQEMTFLGEKAFAKRKNQTIYEEVNGLVDFLNTHAHRKIGDEAKDTHFNGLYCKFGIMIVGRSFRINKEGESPYQKYIRRLAKEGVETIYVIGNSEKQKFITNDVCNKEFLDNINFSIFNGKKYKCVVRYKDEEGKTVNNYLLVLRKTKVEHYIKG